MDIIGVVALVALLAWLFRGKRARPVSVPEDDPDPAIDHRALEAAERELAEDPEAHSVDDERDDDWGPGAPPPGRPRA